MSAFDADSHLDRFLVGWPFVLAAICTGMGIYGAYQHPEAARRLAVEAAELVVLFLVMAVLAWAAGTLYFRVRGDSE